MMQPFCFILRLLFLLFLILLVVPLSIQVERRADASSTNATIAETEPKPDSERITQIDSTTIAEATTISWNQKKLQRKHQKQSYYNDWNVVVDDDDDDDETTTKFLWLLHNIKTANTTTTTPKSSTSTIQFHTNSNSRRLDYQETNQKNERRIQNKDGAVTEQQQQQQQQQQLPGKEKKVVSNNNKDKILPTTNTNTKTSSSSSSNTSFSTISTSSKSKSPLLTVVLHIGPMKTGSSAIQKTFGTVGKELELYDNYQIANVIVRKRSNETSGIWNFIHCFLNDDNNNNKKNELLDKNSKNTNKNDSKNTNKNRKKTRYHRRRLVQDRPVGATSTTKKVQLQKQIPSSSTKTSVVTKKVPTAKSVSLQFNDQCHSDTLTYVEQIGSGGAGQQQQQGKRYNMILSAEYLPSPTYNITRLYNYLYKYWKQHKIIIYYRRYYDWLISFHNQGSKGNPPNHQHRIPIHEFLVKEQSTMKWYDLLYIINAMKRYKDNGFYNIHIINMYELYNQDVREAFYCIGIPNAISACTKYRQKQKEIQLKLLQEQQQKQKQVKLQVKQETIRDNTQPHRGLAVSVDDSDNDEKENSSIALIYSDLVYYANEMKLLSKSFLESLSLASSSGKEMKKNDDQQLVWGSSQMKLLATAAKKMHTKSKKQLLQHQQQNNANGTTITTSASTIHSKYDFTQEDKKCPPNDVIEWLYRTSIDIEKQLVGSASINEFDIHFNQTKIKMCHIDAKHVLEKQNSPWKQYFQSLQ